MASCRQPGCFAMEPVSWHRGREGIVEIGAPEAGSRSTPSPRHRVFLAAHHSPAAA